MDKLPDYLEEADGGLFISFDDIGPLADGQMRIFMRVARVKDQLAVDGEKTPGRREVALLRNLCELDDATIGEMTSPQYGRLQEAAAFLS